jgi:transglutaminase-like putative cysteine protease
MAALIATTVVDARTQVRFDREGALQMRHPEVYANIAFLNWARSHVFGTWREMKRTEDGKQVVIVQAAETDDPEMGYDFTDVANEPVFAAEVQYVGASAAVLHTSTFPSVDVSFLFQAAEQALRLRTRDKITIAQPVVDFGVSPPRLSWDLQVSVIFVPPGVETYHDCATTGDDSMSSNDLHHRKDPILLKEATDAVAGLSTIKDIAEELCHHVQGTIDYNSNNQANVYTESDLIVFAQKSGECDELAVLLTTYLRAVGIHARMKFLRWKRRGLEQQHACVEYTEGGVVYYLDPTSGKVGHPEAYRCAADKNGNYPEDVRVVDVDWPADARSSSDFDYVHDPDGDGLLNPWGDFCYGPDKCGTPRAGYSFDACAVPPQTTSLPCVDP